MLPTRRRTISTLFPYTTLFRSSSGRRRSHHRLHSASTNGTCLRSRARRNLDLAAGTDRRSEEHTSELQSRVDLVCRLLLEKKKTTKNIPIEREIAYDGLFNVQR